MMSTTHVLLVARTNTSRRIERVLTPRTCRVQSLGWRVDRIADLLQSQQQFVAMGGGGVPGSSGAQNGYGMPGMGPPMGGPGMGPPMGGPGLGPPMGGLGLGPPMGGPPVALPILPNTAQ
jgi:hypothetical protein